MRLTIALFAHPELKPPLKFLCLSLLRKAVVFLTIAFAGLCCTSSAEEVALPWGGKISVHWPAPFAPVRIGQSSNELSWEDSAHGWNAALTLFAPANSGFPATLVKDNLLSLMAKSGRSDVASREEHLDNGTLFILTIHPTPRYAHRELWIADTKSGILGVYFSFASDDPDSRRKIIQAILGELCSVKRAQLSEQDMHDDLRELARLAGSAWSWKAMRAEKFGVDLVALEQTLAKRIDAQTTPEQFGLLLREFVAGLQDGHASLRTELVPEAIFRLPFECRETVEGIIVTACAEHAAELKLGDRLVSIAGFDVASQINERIATTSASTPEARRYLAVQGLPRRSTATAVSVEIETIEGVRKVIILVPSVDRPAPPEQITHRKLPNNLGYLRLPSIAQDSALWEKGGRTVESLRTSLEEKFARLRWAFAELRNCSALILDVRDNGGGSDLLGQFLGGAFAPETKNYYFLATHLSPELLALPEFKAVKGTPSQFEKPAPIAIQNFADPLSIFRAKLYLLMNEGCFSATDCFLNFIAYSRPDAVFVGTPNGAGAGGPREIGRLPHSDARFTACVMQVWNLRGDFVEGTAIQPTIWVRTTRADIVAERDAPLEAAVQAADEFVRNKP